MESLKKWTFIVFLILLQNRKIDTMILKNNNIFTLHFSLFFFKKHTLMYLRCKQNCIWFCCRHLKSCFGVRVLFFFLYSRVFVGWSEFLLFQNQISGVISAKNKKVNKLSMNTSITITVCNITKMFAVPSPMVSVRDVRYEKI